jgi:hypothetical protein
MKIGSVREFQIPEGVNKGKTVYSRTIWLQPGERQPGLLDMTEMQDAMQAQHPGQLVGVQTRYSAFAPTSTVADGKADEETT